MVEAHSFGRYKVTGTLGIGGMGHVYAAVDEVLGREVAVKTLHDRGSGLGGQLLDERFRLEARAIAALTHPAIVQVYDIDLASDPPYIVMERVAGPSLKERFTHDRLAEIELRALGIQIARALAAAHAAGIVHRDVKPANILIAGPGTWKLADFGVAHVPDSSLTITGQFVGSPAYAPPEALIAGQSTAAGDVYGLGATLYFGAAGKWPRTDTPSAPLTPVPSLRTMAPDLPDDLIAIIDRAVAIDAKQRPTASELADTLAGRPVVARPVAVVRRIDWNRWGIAAGVVAVAVVIAVIATRHSATPDRATGPVAAPTSSPDDGAPTETHLDDPPPGQLRVVTPPITDAHAAKDWSKLVDRLYDHKFDDARKKLDDWERKWGETEETRSLRRQLAAMPDEGRGRGHHGRGD